MKVTNPVCLLESFGFAAVLVPRSLRVLPKPRSSRMLDRSMRFLQVALLAVVPLRRSRITNRSQTDTRYSGQHLPTSRQNESPDFLSDWGNDHYKGFEPSSCSLKRSRKLFPPWVCWWPRLAGVVMEQTFVTRNIRSKTLRLWFEHGKCKMYVNVKNLQGISELKKSIWFFLGNNHHVSPSQPIPLFQALATLGRIPWLWCCLAVDSGAPFVEFFVVVCGWVNWHTGPGWIPL